MGLDLCAPHNPLSLVHSYFPTGRDTAPLKQEANIFHFSKAKCAVAAGENSCRAFNLYFSASDGPAPQPLETEPRGKWDCIQTLQGLP